MARKADLMAHKPAEMSDREFMDRVLERAREMAPTDNPEEMVTSWQRLQRKPHLVDEIVSLHFESPHLDVVTWPDQPGADTYEIARSTDSFGTSMPALRAARSAMT